MTDDLDDLKAALRAAPSADPAAKAAALRLAMENFDRLQGSTDQARLMDSRPEDGRGSRSGVIAMFKKFALRPALAATTSAVALVAGMVIVLPLIERSPVPAAVENPKAIAEGGGAVLELKEELLADAPAVAAPAPMADTASGAQAMSRMALPQADMALAPATEPVAGAMAEVTAMPVENTEAFANAPANPVQVTAEAPVSTFSIDVDTASYAMLRQSLNAGYLPDPASIRVEEMVNYFPYNYSAPEGDQAFRSTVTVMPTPWNAGTRLVHIGIQGALPALQDRPPLNLVFLIDTSGSMDEPMKLPLLKQSLALVLPDLHPEDQVAIVAYAG